MRNIVVAALISVVIVVVVVRIIKILFLIFRWYASILNNITCLFSHWLNAYKYNMHAVGIYNDVETIFVPTVVNSRFDLQIIETIFVQWIKQNYVYINIQVFVHLLHMIFVSNLYNLDSITKLFRNSFPFAVYFKYFSLYSLQMKTTHFPVTWNSLFINAASRTIEFSAGLFTNEFHNLNISSAVSVVYTYVRDEMTLLKTISNVETK